ncbi:hypothetical protein LPMP_080200 [Leishmania panamensis]|uniref:Uncharacterized protein n=1 Tax=Leishmania panamensis TaxID=5679 RepID=A0A088RKX7_LEIPA|nr:hypothetical protein LPMP_080200 [Leishmania panamensis]AIN95829.1 hypothetical protein LPMP_080200 [Leishmania panamensis]
MPLSSPPDVKPTPSLPLEGTGRGRLHLYSAASPAHLFVASSTPLPPVGRMAALRLSAPIIPATCTSARCCVETEEGRSRPRRQWCVGLVRFTNKRGDLYTIHRRQRPARAHLPMRRLLCPAHVLRCSCTAAPRAVGSGAGGGVPDAHRGGASLLGKKQRCSGRCRRTTEEAAAV